MSRNREGTNLLTGAERSRRWRARKRNPPNNRGLPKTVREYAEATARSERTVYRFIQYNRYKAFDDWGHVLRGEFGRCGIGRIAEICFHNDRRGQRLWYRLIRKVGVPLVRQMWREDKWAAYVAKRRLKK